jgi:hypothetical protein
MDKTSKLLIVLILAILGLQTLAEETASEKATAKTHDARRATKKAWHRSEEAVCMKGDTKCAAEKAKHRMHEGADTVKDKASEAKNAVDTDHK